MRVVTLLITVLIPLAAARAQNLVIHEWGTFTSLQNEHGDALGAINVDDEPVPAFVHTLPASFITNSPGPDEVSAQSLTKGVFPRFHPEITMRLETPVMYFYDRREMDKPLHEDVSVTFNGGYLSQFYPMADTGEAPKLPMREPGKYVPISEATQHTLTWQGVRSEGGGTAPETSSRVWLAPRQTKSDLITVGKESEKYLFYRGVGHLDSPLRVIQGTAPGAASFALEEVNGKHTEVKAAWLLDIRDDGAVAWRKLPSAMADPLKDVKAPVFATTFDPGQYAAENLKTARTAMREALVADGLYEDEADAMLNTWEASYFKSPGLRVFYLVPKQWTDKVLPLKVSADAQITRVMIGRIELIKPEQRALLATISKPEEIKRLGRFAAAILNDEQARNPSPRLQQLIQNAGMSAVEVTR